MQCSDRLTAERSDDAEVWNSVRRDAWRIEAYRLQVAEAQTLRRENAFMRHAIMAGFVLLLASWGYTHLHAFAKAIADTAHASDGHGLQASA